MTDTCPSPKQNVVIPTKSEIFFLILIIQSCSLVCGSTIIFITGGAGKLGGWKNCRAEFF